MSEKAGAALIAVDKAVAEALKLLVMKEKPPDDLSLRVLAERIADIGAPAIEAQYHQVGMRRVVADMLSAFLIGYFQILQSSADVVRHIADGSSDSSLERDA